MSSNFRYSIFCVVFLFIINNSCISIRPDAKKGQSSLVESFYLGNEGVQYFIKPILLQSTEDKKAFFSIDFTFRIKDSLCNNNCIANFTIYYECPIRNIEFIKVSNSLDTVKLEKLEVIFNEKSKKYFINRYTSIVTHNELVNIFQNELWTIQLFADKKSLEFIPSGKTKKQIRKIKINFFQNL